MHCVMGITTTFPNRHMKEGKCSVMTGTGLCKPWKIKRMEKSQATAMWDLDTCDDQKDDDFFLFLSSFFFFFWMGLIFLLAGGWVVGRRRSGMGYLGN